jgi:hypothetical protein
MTKAEEILEKHLASNIDQRTYLRGSKLTYDICINAINEAINYTPCCGDVVCGNCDGYGYTVDENGRRKDHCKECE